MEFYNQLNWPADRKHIENRYEKLLLNVSSPGFSTDRSFPSDLEGWRDEKASELKYEWSLDNFARYLETWSGYRELLARDENKTAILTELKSDLKEELGGDEILSVHFDIFVVYYRKKGNGNGN